MSRDILKTARLIKGLTALRLGELADVREEKVYQVERGRYLPTTDEAVRWAKVLDIEPEVAFPEMSNRLAGDSSAQTSGGDRDA